jgi:hypothetical protein
LHYLLLYTLIRFKNIDDLSEYFEYTLSIDNPVEIIIGLKYFYLTKTSTEYFRYLSKAISALGRNPSSIEYVLNVFVSVIEMIQTRRNYSELLLWWDSYENNFDVLTSDFKCAFLQEFNKWLNIDNPVLENHYMKKLKLLIISKFLSLNDKIVNEYYSVLIRNMGSFPQDFITKILLPLSLHLSNRTINPYIEVIQNQGETGLQLFKDKNKDINHLVTSAYKVNYRHKLSPKERKEATIELESIK